MAKRVSQLTELTVVAVDDYIPIVDTSAGDTKKVKVQTLVGVPAFGWTATGESWTFSSWTSASNVGIVTVPTDATTKYNVGQYVQFVQATGGTKYGKILAVTATTLSIWMPGYTLVNEAITTPFYSIAARPVGLPVAIADGNPYRFSAYCSTGKNLINTSIIVDLQTELADPSNSFASSRFTAPVAGDYMIVGQAWLGAAGTGDTEYGATQIRKNGSVIYESECMNGSNNSNRLIRPFTGGLVSLGAGDYVELWATFVGSRDITAGQANTYMSGQLVSRT